MVIAAILAILLGRSSIVTKMTATMAVTNSIKKSVTDLFTTVGISAILFIFTSEGRVSANPFNTLSTCLPKFTILWPKCISSESTRDLFPSALIYESGSPYSRLIVATSLSLIELPCGSV